MVGKENTKIWEQTSYGNYGQIARPKNWNGWSFEDWPFITVSMAKGQQPVVTIFWGDNLIHINLFDAKFLWLVAVYFMV